MRGLAFPTAAVSQRESSYDYGTPFSGVGNENAIDPALAGETPIDPALLGDEGYSSNGPVSLSTKLLFRIVARTKLDHK